MSGMLPPGLLRKAPTDHQPSTDFSKIELPEAVDEKDERGKALGQIKEDEDDDFVPNAVKRLQRRTETERLSVMSAYIKRQEDLRKQFKRAKLEEEESGEEDWENEEDDEEGSESEWETASDTDEDESAAEHDDSKKKA